VLIPDAWLTTGPQWAGSSPQWGTPLTGGLTPPADAPFATPAAQRDAYLRYLTSRLRAPRAFAEEAAHARAQLV
jgi:hypothetical protein